MYLRILLIVGALICLTSPAIPQTFNWLGTGTCYNCPGSWSSTDPFRVPDVPGESAQFGDVAGQTDVIVNSPLTFPDAWIFNNNTRDYEISGRNVFFSGQGLVSNGSGNIFIRNALTGTGGVTQNGTGILALLGRNTYTGATNLNFGSLFILGTIQNSSELTTDEGTFLGGVGNLPGTEIGGIVSPGPESGSVGTFNIMGDLGFSNQATYHVDFDPVSGANDLFLVTEDAQLRNANLTVDRHGFIPVVNQPYPIVTATGGVQGKFQFTTQNLPLASVGVTYDKNNAYFLVQRNQVPICQTCAPSNPIVLPPDIPPIIPPVEPTEPPIAITPPEEAIGGVIDELPPDNPILGGIVLLPTIDEIRDALDQLSGDSYPTGTTIALINAMNTQTAMNNALAASTDYLEIEAEGDADPESGNLELPAASRFGQNITWWIDTSASRTTMAENTSDDYQLFIGGDTRITDEWILGSMIGYDHLKSSGRNNETSSDNFTLGAYTGYVVPSDYQYGNWILKGGAAYTWNLNSADRNVNFPGFMENFHADYNASTFQGFGGIAYKWRPATGISIEPFADLAYLRVAVDSFREEGGIAALDVESSAQGIPISTLGVRLSNKFEIEGQPLKAKFRMGWRHAYGDLTPVDHMRFAVAQDIVLDSFEVPGIPLAENTALVDFGLEAAISESTNLSFAYNGQFSVGAKEGESSQTHSFSAMLRMKF